MQAVWPAAWRQGLGCEVDVSTSQHPKRLFRCQAPQPFSLPVSRVFGRNGFSRLRPRSVPLRFRLRPAASNRSSSTLRLTRLEVNIAHHKRCEPPMCTLASVMPVHFRRRVKRPYPTAVKRGGALPFLNPYPLSTFTKTVRQALRKHGLLLSQTPLHHRSQPWRPSSLPQSLPPFCSPPKGVHNNMYRSIIFALIQTGFVPDPHSIPVVACIACAALPGHTT